MHTDQVVVGIGPVAPEDVVRVARGGCGVRLADEALAEIGRSRAIVDGLAGDDQPHYGISTGFGALATKHIPLGDARPTAAQPDPLARRRLRSRGGARGRPRADAAAAVDPGDRAHRRAGGDGQAYAAMLDAGITPVVHEYGSLGCSGDLAPLRRSRWR